MFGKHRKTADILAQAANAHHRHKRGRGHSTVHGDLTITHGPTGALTFTHQPHGEDDLNPDFEATPEVGDIGEIDLQAFGHLQSTYGAGDTGRGFRPMLMSGAEDPFANVMQPGDPEDYLVKPLPYRRADGYDGGADPAGMVDEYTDDLQEAYQPVGPDRWNFIEQIPTLRNPRTDFGGEYYPFQGPAAIIGCDMGCAAPGGARLKG
jgi:hypothetical protein